MFKTSSITENVGIVKTPFFEKFDYMPMIWLMHFSLAVNCQHFFQSIAHIFFLVGS